MEHDEEAQWMDELGKLREEIVKVKEVEHECRRAEEAVENEPTFVSAILDTAGALVVVLDPKGRIVRFNHACEDATGYTLEEVRAKVSGISLSYRDWQRKEKEEGGPKGSSAQPAG
jgi:PAS domain-containing protein